jgi:hypothetical protein
MLFPAVAQACRRVRRRDGLFSRLRRGGPNCGVLASGHACATPIGGYASAAQSGGYPYDPFQGEIKTQLQLRIYRFGYSDWFTAAEEVNMTPPAKFIPFPNYREYNQIIVQTQRFSDPSVFVNFQGGFCSGPWPGSCNLSPNLSKTAAIVTYDYYHAGAAGTIDWEVGAFYQNDVYGTGTITLRQVFVNLTTGARIFDRDCTFHGTDILLMPREWRKGLAAVSPGDNLRFAWVFSYLLIDDALDDFALKINLNRLPGLVP